MGRHINADAVVDELPSVTLARTQAGPVPSIGPVPPSAPPPGVVPPAASHPLEQQSYISPDTHIGQSFEVAPGTPDAAASPANPDALVERGRVGDGHELD